MSPFNNNKRLDNSSGIGQDNSNEAMQTASETTESLATAKKSRWTCKSIGLIAISFLLVTGILMMPTKVTQNEAKAADPLTWSVVITSSATFIVHTALRWGSLAIH